MKALEILKDNYLSGQSDEMALYFQRHIQIAIKELEELENRSCSNCEHCEEFYRQYLDDIEFWYKCKNLKNPNIINLTDIKTFYCNKWENKHKITNI